MPQLRSVDQLALDEVTIDDAELEAALDLRLAKKAALNAVSKDYDDAHAAALAQIELQELPDGGALRVGRHRVSRSTVSARSVTFETKATTRIRITDLGGEG